MEEFKVRNLRSLVEDKYIKFAPITIFLGKNSSGKSSLIRSLPLLKQTVANAASGNILWYGDLVDFGDFKNAVNSEVGKGGTIEFGFKFVFRLSEINNMLYVDDDYPDERDSRRVKLIQCVVELSYKDVKFGQSSLSRCLIRVFDHEIIIVFDSIGGVSKFEINGLEMNKSGYIMKKELNSQLVPEISQIRLIETEDGREIRYLGRVESRRDMFNHLDDILRSGLNYEYKAAIIRKISLDSKDNMLRSFRNRDKFRSTFVKKATNWDIDSEEFNILISRYVFFLYSRIARGCNNYLNGYFRRTHYLAPIRATANRYYRIQNLAVVDISPSGENLPMVLRSLSKKNMSALNLWLRDNFDFELNVIIGGGQTSLRIFEGDSNKSVNLSDMGFGYSQILPIIIQIWLVKNRSEIKRYSQNGLSNYDTFIIEQPELHLHPAMQALFADVICQISLDRTNNMRFMIETHSETIINRISNRINKKLFPKDFVKIYVFNKTDNYTTNVIESNFDEKGMLDNWPIGFFNPSRISRNNDNIS